MNNCKFVSLQVIQISMPYLSTPNISIQKNKEPFTKIICSKIKDQTIDQIYHNRNLEFKYVNYNTGTRIKLAAIFILN